MFQDQLISAIKNGHYQLGDKLPSERELCAQFQVSRVSVREAIAGLAVSFPKAQTRAIDHVAQMHDWVSNFKNDEAGQ